MIVNSKSKKLIRASIFFVSMAVLTGVAAKPVGLVTKWTKHWYWDKQSIYDFQRGNAADYFFVKEPLSKEEDKAGVLLKRYEFADTPQYNPILIAQAGLYYATKASEDSAARQKFIIHADWIAEHALDPKSPIRGLLYHYFPVPYYQLTPPWPSGMAQGQAISLLVRASRQLGGQKYRIAAEAVFEACRIPVTEGGVLGRLANGGLWLEEYPGSTSVPHVLNGFLFALIGLNEYARFSGDASAWELYEQLEQSLVQNIGEYDLGYWSKYSLGASFFLATEKYHLIHIMQLHEIAAISRKPEVRSRLLEVAGRFSDYYKQPYLQFVSHRLKHDAFSKYP